MEQWEGLIYPWWTSKPHRTHVKHVILVYGEASDITMVSRKLNEVRDCCHTYRSWCPSVFKEQNASITWVFDSSELASMAAHLSVFSKPKEPNHHSRNYTHELEWFKKTVCWGLPGRFFRWDSCIFHSCIFCTTSSSPLQIYWNNYFERII